MCGSVLKDATPGGLLDKIYKREGWTRKEGEVRSRRASTLYKLAVDHRANRYTATPLCEGRNAEVSA